MPKADADGTGDKGPRPRQAAPGRDHDVGRGAHGELRDLTKQLLAYGARMPKELMLFVKDILFLDGAVAALAPGLDLLGEVALIADLLLRALRGKRSQPTSASIPARSRSTSTLCDRP